MVKPDGAFYLFPKAMIEDDVEFVMEAKKYNLLLVPGSGFGYPGYFRIFLLRGYGHDRTFFTSIHEICRIV